MGKDFYSTRCCVAKVVHVCKVGDGGVEAVDTHPHTSECERVKLG